MAKYFQIVLVTLCLYTSLTTADWNIMNQRTTRSGLKISLKNYCESWRMNVELNNIQEFHVVPEECVDYVGKYMSGTQYKADSEGAIDQCKVFVSTSCKLKNDGRDAWIFDIDDTLLSTLPYYKKHHFGGEKLNLTSLEEWMNTGTAPALDNSLKLFNDLKAKGFQIMLVSARRETLRSATIDNLVNVGYHGWTSLILRGPNDECVSVQSYKARVRNNLVANGYRIWGILGDQWSSIQGFPTAKRVFKLPNSLYYIP